MTLADVRHPGPYPRTVWEPPESGPNKATGAAFAAHDGVVRKVVMRCSRESLGRLLNSSRDSDYPMRHGCDEAPGIEPAMHSVLNDIARTD